MGFVNNIFLTVPKHVHFTLVGASIFLFLFCLFSILWLIKQLLEVLIFNKIATNYYNYIYLVVQCILFTSWVVENHYIMVAVFYKKSNITYKYYSKIKLIYLVLKILATKPFCWMVSYMVYNKIVKKGLGNQKNWNISSHVNQFWRILSHDEISEITLSNHHLSNHFI